MLSLLNNRLTKEDCCYIVLYGSTDSKDLLSIVFTLSIKMKEGSCSSGILTSSDETKTFFNNCRPSKLLSSDFWFVLVAIIGAIIYISGSS